MAVRQTIPEIRTGGEGQPMDLQQLPSEAAAATLAITGAATTQVQAGIIQEIVHPHGVTVDPIRRQDLFRDLLRGRLHLRLIRRQGVADHPVAAQMDAHAGEGRPMLSF